MNVDGGDVQRLTRTAGVTEWSAKFSRDGTRVAYAADTGTGWYLDLMDADGSNQEHVAGPYKFTEFPSWRRSGPVEVLFSAIEQGRDDADILSYDATTREVKTRISTPAADVCPHFTYDGKTLTYATAPPGDATNVDLFAHDLSSDDASGAQDTRLTDAPGLDDYGNPSPDDTTIVFVSDREDPGETYDERPNAATASNTDLYLMDRDGKNQRRLTDTPDSRENVPDW
jgi:Tol biopolymer transport system component